MRTTIETLAEKHITIEVVDNKYIAVRQYGEKHMRVYYLNSRDMIEFSYQGVEYALSSYDSKDLIRAFRERVDARVTAEMEPKRTVEVEFTKPVEPGKHEKHDLIKTCIENDIPVYLVGDVGTGKNYTLQQIAEELGMSFYFTNSVQQEFKITGFIDAVGVYHETEFYKAFKNGGVFFLDEIDASIPEVLVLLNSAIANKYFEFPNGKITAHEQFRVVSAGNTVGSGASDLYTGRLVLDQATLDRFVIIEFDYSREIEMVLAEGNEHLVNFIRQLRKSAKSQGIRATFSYRSIISVVKLEKASIPLKTILEISVFKGMDKDTVKTLKTDYSMGSAGKYHYALKELQA